MKSISGIIFLFLLPIIIGISIPEKETYTIETEGDAFFPEKLDGPFTGGFGEQTCHSCHFDYDVNMDGGSLTLSGITNNYQPGKLYDITVSVESEHLENGGFQMTARFEDGTQAGSFKWEENRLMLTPSVNKEIEYIQHIREGTLPTGDREVSWSFFWQSPDDGSLPVIFNIAANAGNNDDSAFGDWIYVKEKVLLPKQ